MINYIQSNTKFTFNEAAPQRGLTQGLGLMSHLKDVMTNYENKLHKLLCMNVQVNSMTAAQEVAVGDQMSVIKL